jgi:hypothetical protein
MGVIDVTYVKVCTCAAFATSPGVTWSATHEDRSQRIIVTYHMKEPVCVACGKPWKYEEEDR